MHRIEPRSPFPDLPPITADAPGLAHKVADTRADTFAAAPQPAPGDPAAPVLQRPVSGLQTRLSTRVSPPPANEAALSQAIGDLKLTPSRPLFVRTSLVADETFSDRIGQGAQIAARKPEVRAMLDAWGVSQGGNNQLFEHLQGKSPRRLEGLANRLGLQDDAFSVVREHKDDPEIAERVITLFHSKAVEIATTPHAHYFETTPAVRKQHCYAPPAPTSTKKKGDGVRLIVTTPVGEATPRFTTLMNMKERDFEKARKRDAEAAPGVE